VHQKLGSRNPWNCIHIARDSVSFRFPNQIALPYSDNLSKTVVFESVVNCIDNSIQYRTSIIWIKDLLTILHRLLNLPRTYVHSVSVLNHHFQVLPKFPRQLGSHPSARDIQHDVWYLTVNETLEWIYINGIQSILFFHSELTLIQVSFSCPPSSSPSSLPLVSEPSKVYVWDSAVAHT